MGEEKRCSEGPWVGEGSGFWSQLLPKPKRWVNIMPTVLREHGFQIVIHFGPREHGPAHVHVFRIGWEAIVTLGDERSPPRVRNAGRMPEVELRRAVEIVADNQAFLLQKWRMIYENLAAD